MYFWNPIPPSADYVSLGMVATNTDEPPDLDQVRCIPAQWVVKVEEAPRKVWDDAGLSGRPGSVWEINSMNHFVATVGHDPPQGVPGVKAPALVHLAICLQPVIGVRGSHISCGCVHCSRTILRA